MLLNHRSVRTPGSADLLGIPCQSRSRTPESANNSVRDYFTFISISETNNVSQVTSNEDQWLVHGIILNTPTPVDHQKYHVTQSNSLDTNEQESSDFAKMFISCLFPTLRSWSAKSTKSKINDIASAPFLFFFIVTIPVTRTDEVTQHVPQPSVTTSPSVPVSHSYTSSLSVIVNLLDSNMEEESAELEDDNQVAKNKAFTIIQAICSISFITCALTSKYYYNNIYTNIVLQSNNIHFEKHWNSYQYPLLYLCLLLE
jgi:hypothetical protein